MLPNGISLCYGHHMMAHANPLDFAEMMRERLGVEQYDEIRRLSESLTKREPISETSAVEVALPDEKRSQRRAHPRALRDGPTRRELAEMFDLTPQRIDQIVRI